MRRPATQYQLPVVQTPPCLPEGARLISAAPPRCEWICKRISDGGAADAHGSATQRSARLERIRKGLGPRSDIANATPHAPAGRNLPTGNDAEPQAATKSKSWGAWPTIHAGEAGWRIISSTGLPVQQNVPRTASLLHSCIGGGAGISWIDLVPGDLDPRLRLTTRLNHLIFSAIERPKRCGKSIEAPAWACRQDGSEPPARRREGGD
jgi:hypothetical protein